MIFSSARQKIEYSKKLYICEKEISAVKSTKFLGVVIDQHLRWHAHVSHIKKKIAKGLGIISKAKKYLNYESLRTLYFSFIHPYFDYCLEVWGSANKTLITSIFRLQKKAIRSITMSSYRANTESLFKFCKIFTLEELHVFKISLFMFRVHKRIAPEIFFFIILQRIPCFIIIIPEVVEIFVLQDFNEK